MVVKRNYSGKDVDMLIATSTMMNSAIEHQTYLVTKRPIWADPYFKDILTEIDTVIQKHLGVDNARQLRAATAVVKSIQAPALFDLAEFKVQIESDFDTDKTQKNEILNTLGFKAYNADAKKLDQEALINLLFQFKTNATPALVQTITEKGTSQKLIDNIISYADKLKDANIAQEGKKGTKKEVTQEAIIDFNTVYKKVIAIAKIAVNFFKDNQAVKEQFSYTSVKNKINNTKESKDPTA
ncbi:hypothetical protein [Flavobacterium sp. SM2513]|uniref:hypothetical protein n=1 Tax=Flavobacterium sp. SM2513 TaxID=3424766 RepID=UPI003D7FD836